MKLATLVFFFLFTQAFAATCEDLEYIYESEETTVKPFRVADTHGKFSALEQQMIKVAVESDGYYRDLSIKEALEIFADKNQWHDVGYNSGSIFYSRYKGAVLAKVVYYPGDNEYGAIFQVRSGSFKKLAEVHDGDLGCL